MLTAIAIPNAGLFSSFPSSDHPDTIAHYAHCALPEIRVPLQSKNVLRHRNGVTYLECFRQAPGIRDGIRADHTPVDRPNFDVTRIHQ